jgi:hypothetical protein
MIDMGVSKKNNIVYEPGRIAAMNHRCVALLYF